MPRYGDDDLAGRQDADASEYGLRRMPPEPEVRPDATITNTGQRVEVLSDAGAIWRVRDGAGEWSVWASYVERDA